MLQQTHTQSPTRNDRPVGAGRIAIKALGVAPETQEVSSSSTLRPKPSKVGLRRAARAAGVAAAAAVIISAGAQGASAAAPYGDNFYLHSYGSSGTIPTWGWGSATTLCVTNHGASAANVYVKPEFGSAYEWMYVSANSRKCIARSWWGNPVKVTNYSYNLLHVRSY
jgi:hypothetical protein